MTLIHSIKEILKGKLGLNVTSLDFAYRVADGNENSPLVVRLNPTKLL